MNDFPAPPGSGRVPRIDLSHGAGGRAMRDLIRRVFVAAFDNPALRALDDQARLPLSDFVALGDRLAFTTDGYVVDPLFFRGGDIGTLAVNGTINDLAVGGALPLALSCAVIVEEGCEEAVLQRVVASMAAAARDAGVPIVTGDTKVVPRGAADKLFVTTAGIGVVREGLDLDPAQIRAGDMVLVSGAIGDHGIAVLNARGDLALDIDVASDCRSLSGLVQALLDGGIRPRCLRDATRGGLAAVLNEFAEGAALGICIREDALPVREPVKAACELLGLDPLYLANEGAMVLVVPAADAGRALAILRAHPHGRDAASIGAVTAARAGRVVMATVAGGERVVDLLVGEQLPRIC